MIHYQLPPTLEKDIDQFERDLLDFRQGHLHETSFLAKRVKLGVYQERGDQTYMCRIRCGGNVITPKQLEKTAELAGKYGSPRVHVTTRAELQIHNVGLDDVAVIMRELALVGLSMKGGGGHTTRNIYTNADSGTNPNEVFDVQPHVIALTSRLIAEPDSFELPRKFKMSFSSLAKDAAFCTVQDLGFIARINGEGKKGFQVFVGGGLGAKPKIGILLHDFIQEDRVFHVVRSIKNVFHTHGNRRMKNHSRIRFLIHDDLGEENFRALYTEELKRNIDDDRLKLDVNPIDNEENQHRQADLDPVTEGLDGFSAWKARAVSEQKQKGLFTIRVPLDLGDLSRDDCFRLGRILKPFGDNVLRCGMDQNFYVRNIPSQFLKNVYKGLRTLYTLTEKPLFFGQIIPCTGAQTCQLGINYPRPATEAIFRHLDASDLDFDAFEEVTIRVSGCPNSCANHWVGDLGFFGRVRQNGGHPIPTYSVLGGARVETGKTELGERVGWIHSKDLPEFLERVLREYGDYKRNKNGVADFHGFWHETGKVFVRDLCENRFNQIPSFEVDKNYYFDHGAEEIFSTKNIVRKSECSAGIYDMIDVDKKSVQKNLDLIAVWENGRPGLNGILKETVFFASRMLLVTRGEEPRTKTETFDLFLKHFIGTGLVDKSHRFVVEVVRNGETEGLGRHKNRVMALGSEIITLYEGMDDTMRFPGEKENLTIKMEKRVESTLDEAGKMIDKFKDLRGVKCPINFAQTKIQMAAMKAGQTLELFLDDGEPILNVPASVKLEGHKILNQKKIGNYWTVVIEKN